MESYRFTEILSQNIRWKASKMVQWVRNSLCKPGHLSLIPRVHVKEEEKNHNVVP